MKEFILRLSLNISYHFHSFASPALQVVPGCLICSSRIHNDRSICISLTPSQWPECNHSTFVFSSVHTNQVCFFVLQYSYLLSFLFPQWFQQLVYILLSALYLVKFMATEHNSIISQFLKFLNSNNLIFTSNKHNHIILQVHKHWHFIVFHILHVLLWI